MAAEAVDAEELVQVPNCRAVLIGTLQASSSEAAPAPVVQFAAGVLRICKLPSSAAGAPEELPRVVLAITDDGVAPATLDGGFYYPILADMPVCKAGGRCLTLPDPEGGDNFGILFDEGGLETVADLLASCGCRVWHQSAADTVAALAQESKQVPSVPSHGKTAEATASTVQGAAAAATGAIKMATGALSWGIRAATAEVKQSPLMAPMQKPVAVPSSVKQTASTGRQASHAVVQVSGIAIDSVTKLAGSMAGSAASVTGVGGGSGHSNGWVADAAYVGGSSVSAAVEVFLALNEAADQLVQESLGSTADLVGHKLGDEAGATTREGFHVVGNVMAAKSLLSQKALAKTVAKGTATEAARAVVGTPHAAAPSPTDAVPSSALGSGMGIRLGPQ